MRPTYVWAALLAFLAMLGALTALILAGADPTPIIAFLTGAPATVLGAVAAYRASRIERQVTDQGAVLQTVNKNVNGHLTAALAAAGIPPQRTDDAQETSA